MRKWILPVVVIAVVVVIGVAGSLEAGPKKKMDGKVLYRHNCKPCHMANSPNGYYQPLTLIQDQWNRFFDKKFESTHADVDAPEHEGQKLLDVLDEEMIKKIRKFAVDHAADSENPMTCG